VAVVRIAVRTHLGVKHLCDTGDVRPPRANMAMRRLDELHAKNVQDDQPLATAQSNDDPCG